MIGPGDASLAGRGALVTGAAVGIGEAIALALARFGADVAVCDRDADGLGSTREAISGLGRRSLSAVLDVREPEPVRAFVSSVVEELGHLDIVVNNAGGGFSSLFSDMSDKGQDALVRENFTSVTHVVRAALPHLGAGASIINVTSVEAHRAGPTFAVYSAMKAAVASLTKSLAVELGDRLIRVNCIAPDVIPTPGVGDLGGTVASPLGRRGHVDDVAGAAVWLAGDLSRFVTGSTIHVDGGTWAAGGWRRQPDGGFHP